MTAERVLSALATVNETLADLASRLRRVAGVAKASHGLDVRRLRDGIYLDAYVEADLASANTLIWWLEAHSRGGDWIVTPEVRIQTDLGQDLLISLDEVAVPDDNLPETLERLGKELSSTAERIDISAT